MLRLTSAMRDRAARLEALDKSQASIEFSLDGTILDANENFLRTMGYEWEEISRQHHRMFVEPTHAESMEYRQFWDRLRQGEFQSAEYKRVGKGGKEVWIRATYSPVMGRDGKPQKVVKYALDVTEQKRLIADYVGQIEALGKSQAVIHFNTDGFILHANENFLRAMGYELDEIKGKHHRMFVEADQATSPDYYTFWQRLAQGEYQSAEYKRLGKNGREIWIQASYNPIFGNDGKVVKIVKYATDITRQKLEYADYIGQIDAVNKSQAVIHFDMQGNILDANRNFQQTMGYELDEIKGKHHRMFVDGAEANSQAYHDFWYRLNNGEFQAAEYKRVAKGGKEVWLQATYNPIFDMNGRPFKIVKYATDITQQKLRVAEYVGQIDAVNKSQAVIHFDMDGNIQEANENFLRAMGYHLDEIKGRHHRMFVEPDYATGAEYQEFWRRLNNGEYQSGEYKRLGKGGREVWIQASYNPILDMSGKPFKVVKYAVDITGQMAARKEVASSTDQALMNVQAVAASVEEMNSSISEIARTMGLSRETIENICVKMGDVDTATKQLQEAATAMDNVVQMIQKTADQISLLALNATIESARAGEAGKGFAVVAGEVKNLANQTTNATGQISHEIQAMQTMSSQVAEALNGIASSINSVREFISGIASAIEEQTAVTKEITSNMHNASSRVAAISDSVNKIVKVA
ncbi:PAS domain-containing protein [bacterium]|nr:PAS domain-containing protein [bacterium]